MTQPYSPSAFWFSKLRTARECLRRYRLEHIDGIKVDNRSLDMEFGTALNLGLDEILRGEGDGNSVFDLYWSTTSPDLPRFRYDHAALAKMAPIFFEKFIDQYMPHIKPVAIGERYFGKIGKHDFEGEFDLLCEYKGVLTVVDFKTASANYAKEKIVVEEQMPGYAELIRQKTGVLPAQRMFLVFVKDFNAPKIQKPLISPLTSMSQSDILSNIEATCDDLVSRKSFPKNTESCVRGSIICPHFDRCHKGVKNERS
jgi:hypothetical protein